MSESDGVRQSKSGVRSEAWELEHGRAQITSIDSVLIWERGGYLLQMILIAVEPRCIAFD